MDSRKVADNGGREGCRAVDAQRRPKSYGPIRGNGTPVTNQALQDAANEGAGQEVVAAANQPAATPGPSGR